MVDLHIKPISVKPISVKIFLQFYIEDGKGAKHNLISPRDAT
jgi:hypothetical protein